MNYGMIYVRKTVNKFKDFEYFHRVPFLVEHEVITKINSGNQQFFLSKLDKISFKCK